MSLGIPSHWTLDACILSCCGFDAVVDGRNRYFWKPFGWLIVFAVWWIYSCIFVPKKKIVKDCKIKENFFSKHRYTKKNPTLCFRAYISLYGKSNCLYFIFHSSYEKIWKHLFFLENNHSSIVGIQWKWKFNQKLQKFDRILQIHII